MKELKRRKISFFFPKTHDFFQEYYIVHKRGIGWGFSLLFKKNIPYEGLIYIYTKKEKLRILRKV
jgi:hypothetical protein